jgi:hypothetical protein
LDYVVHINNGSEAAKPIVLRLLPGEETIFNLKVVNHGDPSNVSLEASDPVFKAVRLKKPDHYVVMEETIPVMARMPDREKRLDGEIVLTGSKGISRVPIYLLRDSEDPGIDLDDPRVQGDEDLKDDSEYEGDDDSGLDENDDDIDDEDESVARKADKDRIEDSEDEDREEDDFDKIEQVRELEPAEEKEVKRIVFSRDRDLQRYKSATRPSNTEEPLIEPKVRRSEEHVNYRIEDKIEGQIENKIEESATGQRVPPEHQTDYQDFRQTPSYVSQEIPTSSETNLGDAEERDGYEDHEEGLIDNFGGISSLQIIPSIIFMALIFVLVITFVTGTIPEFPGALASSILIVTLIIYGAATLLKA